MQVGSGHGQTIRNIKSFKMSLVVGVAAGGVFGSAVDKTLEMTQLLYPLNIWTVATIGAMYICSILLISWAIVFQIALSKTRLVYHIKMPPETIGNIVESAISACASEVQIVDILDSLQSRISDPEQYKEISIRTIRDFSSRLQKASRGKQKPIKASLKKIHSFSIELQDVQASINSCIDNSTALQDFGWELSRENERMLISRLGEQDTHRFTIILSKNRMLSLDTPFICTLSANQKASEDDFISVKTALESLFAEVLEEDTIMEFGLYPYLPAEEDLQQTLLDKITNPLLRKMEEIESIVGN